ncbi:MAG: DUF1273 domain-containing protein [Firmicutes bacterium]|nr:DUF1273 domain-containing protein [[Eubacterium] siraeum]MCM1489123.1 DUF1273 domain-containing protein [Bacillota bacterium]
MEEMIMEPPVTLAELNRSVAFTGYRSHKLPFGHDLNHPSAISLRNALYKESRSLIENHGFRCFLTGGAEGSDLMMAEVVLELKREFRHLGIQHCLCLPCRNHDKRWRQEDKDRLAAIAKKSHVFYITEGEYCDGCMQKRNRYMVNTSCVLLAVYDGKKGGTKSTVEYARKCGRKIITFRPTDPVIRIEEFLDSDLFNWYGMTLKEYKRAYLVNK